MGEARAKAAGEMGGPIKFGRKTGVSVEGEAVPVDNWGKGPSKGVEAIVEVCPGEELAERAPSPRHGPEHIVLALPSSGHR